MQTFLTIVHIFACFLIILVVLIQSGKGADISASFGGGGGSQTLFGSSGGANFFSRFTAVIAAIFMMTSVGLTILSTQRSSIFDRTTTPSVTQGDEPATTAPESDQ